MPPPPPRTHIYLSPHYDDVALSCGATIARQTRAGQRVIVVTVFAGMPRISGVPRFARAMHRRMGAPGADADTMIHTRRDEDRAAMAILGAERLWLEHVDAVYRYDDRGGERYGWRYGNTRALFGAVHESERELARELADAITDAIIDVIAHTTAHKMEHAVRLYAPLALGDHVDHRHVRDAGWQLWSRGVDLWFYEDFPYAEQHDIRPEARPDARPPLEPRIEPCTSDDIDTRIRAILAYRSQIGQVLGDIASMPERVRAATVRHEPDQRPKQPDEPNPPGERFWVPISSPDS